MKRKPTAVPEIIKNLNPVTEQFGPMDYDGGQMQIPGGPKPSLPKALSSKKAEKIEDAALIGGSAMAPSEPFGSALGAAVGAAEEGFAMLTKKTHKGE